jgi:hypothetical protein
MSSRSSASRARHNATQRSRCAGPSHHVATKCNHGCARARAQARRERGPISRRAMERTPHGRRGFSVGPEGKPTLMQPVLVLATLACEQLALVRQRRVVCAHPVTNQARSRNLTFGNFRTGNFRKLPNRKLSETSEPETAEPTRRGRVLSSHFAEATRRSSCLRAPLRCGCAAWAVALCVAAQSREGSHRRQSSDVRSASAIAAFASARHRSASRRRT